MHKPLISNTQSANFLVSVHQGQLRKVVHFTTSLHTKRKWLPFRFSAFPIRIDQRCASPAHIIKPCGIKQVVVKEQPRVLLLALPTPPSARRRWRRTRRGVHAPRVRRYPTARALALKGGRARRRALVTARGCMRARRVR